MDEALERLLQVSSDGVFYIGSVQVPKQRRGKTEFEPKVCILYDFVHACRGMHRSVVSDGVLFMHLLLVSQHSRIEIDLCMMSG